MEIETLSTSTKSDKMQKYKPQENRRKTPKTTASLNHVRSERNFLKLSCVQPERKVTNKQIVS